MSFPTATATAAPHTLPPFTEEHEELRESIRRFIDNELRPHASEWEEARWFPNEVFTRMAELGFLGLKYPEQYGGQGGDYLHDAVLAEELSRCGSGGLAAGIGAHISIATPPIWKFGTEDQKQRFLSPAIAGEKIGALGITEPDAGSTSRAAHPRGQVDGGCRKRLEALHH
jgi:alkylation response protein AidB-like acyl-CoA dehydrogenase